ncbi:MAG: hypothetical protein ACR2LL_13250 [Nitrosopumilus sp.]|uniref:hypothetical protein n=1 Tax=Nitrosopumilus sp. TaxID=2024843 RepID=UPI00292FAEDB|nr:hypothetical protein [Nitrosopumilus sp.]
MKELPKRFPEYSIMYKTILKKVQELESKIEETDENEKEKEKIQLKIKVYEEELTKIKKIFPDGFFEDYS